MYSMEIEFNEFDENKQWNEVYQRIRNESSKSDVSTSDARKEPNRSRNRYRDVNPYNHSRVKLNSENDYINASLVEAPKANRKYILTQGPLSHTSGHFWQMVWEQNTRAVIMLNKVIEKDAVKCHQYWPRGAVNGGEDIMEFKEGFRVVFKEDTVLSEYTVNTLELYNTKEAQSREILHFHCTTWPDFGVPESPGSFLHFLQAVRDAGVLNSDVGPAVIHCSAGIGRSGTFCLVDTCLILIEQSRSPDVVNIREVLLEMRQYRMGLIQTAAQLRFSYLAIIDGAHQIMQQPLNVTDIQRNTIDIVNSLESMKRESAASLELETSGYEEEEIIKNKENDLRVSNNPEDQLTNASPINPSHIASDTELRKRTRQERNKDLSEKIEQMKQKQRESEKPYYKRSAIRPLAYAAGILIILTGGFLLFRYYHHS